MSWTRRKFATSLIFSALYMNTASTSAQTSTPTPEIAPNDSAVQIGLRPRDGRDGDRFMTEIEPGSSVDLVAVIESYGPDPIELRTFTADVAPMVNGGLGVREQESEQHEPTTWMTYTTEEFTLETGEQVEKPFTISVPDGTPPGEYVNALVLETVNPIPTEQETAFDQYFRKVVSVYIIVPGPLAPSFELGDPFIDVEGSEGVIFVPIRNTGNVRIDLAGGMTLANAAGDTVLEVPVSLGPIYGGQETVMRVYVATVPPEGEYQVSVDLADDERDVANSLEGAALQVSAVESDQVAPIVFESVEVAGNGDPIQFANVSVEINLSSTSYRSTRLTMSVFHDGEVVEDFVLADNLSLPLGTTTVQQRYLPLTGWESGTYTFSLKLEDTSSGGAVELYTETDVATIEVP